MVRSACDNGHKLGQRGPNPEGLSGGISRQGNQGVLEVSRHEQACFADGRTLLFLKESLSAFVTVFVA